MTRQATKLLHAAAEQTALPKRVARAPPKSAAPKVTPKATLRPVIVMPARNDTNRGAGTVKTAAGKRRALVKSKPPPPGRHVEDELDTVTTDCQDMATEPSDDESNDGATAALPAQTSQ